ncbi:MAG: hypothetical protein HKN08_01800 [Gammaproteobacteria bacterium]|nr:hypothetical protein [Gammaproteobacteria bacterium]
MNTATQRTVLLHGTPGQGVQYIKDFKREGVINLVSVSDLENIIHNQSEVDNNRKINSVLIVTKRGDDISKLQLLYEFAHKLNILVTTIIIYRTACKTAHRADIPAELRKISDMVIYTSDEEYLKFMIECIT